MDQDTFYINFYEPIDPFKVKNIMGAIGTIFSNQPNVPRQFEPPKRLYILFSSHGGNVDSAIILYTFLKSLPVEIVMHSTGSIDSSGLIVFLAGKKRLASKHSTFLIHPVTWNFFAGAQHTRDSWSEQDSMWSASEIKFRNIVTENTTIPNSELNELLRFGRTKDATWANEKGIVTEISNPIIPPNAFFYPFNIPEQPRVA